MKRLILFNLLLGMVVLCSTSVEAQTQDQNRKISRKEQREIAQQQANQQFEIARQALKDSMFVVEVDRIIGQLGRTVYIQHGCFEYCCEHTAFDCRRCHRRYAGNLDDLKGCLSGQAQGQTLFQTQ